MQAKNTEVPRVVDGRYPLEVCYRQGQTHKAYGWARVPKGGWNDEQTAAYDRGFRGEPFEVMEKQNENL